VKLAALYDRNRHPHPPMLYHVYKLFFICEMVGGKATFSHETDGVDFFGLDELPELSTARVTGNQLARLFEHHQQMEFPSRFFIKKIRIRLVLKNVQESIKLIKLINKVPGFPRIGIRN